MNSVLLIPSAEVAQNIREESHGLIFGFNVFLAAGLQVLLTLIVSSEDCLALDIKPQFIVYGGINLLLGIAFLLVSLFTLFGSNNSDSGTPKEVVTEKKNDKVSTDLHM